MLSKQLFLLVCFVAYATCQTYTRLGTNDCGSRNVRIDRLSYSPMPIIQPGNGQLSIAITASKPITGVVNANLNIMRTVNRIKLPIKCYKVDGNDVGSCNYPDLCTLMKRIFDFDQTTCPQQLKNSGIDCTCPLSLTQNSIDATIDVTIPKTPDVVNWLSVGDFDVRLTANIPSSDIYGCYDIQFAVKPSA